MENKKSKFLKVLLFLTIIVIIVMGVLLYNQKIKSVIEINNLKTNISELENEINNLQESETEIEEEIEKSETKEIDNKTYNVNDYVSVIQYHEFDTLKDIEFNRLPLRTYTELESKNSHFISIGASKLASSKDSEFITASNEIIYGIDRNILSVYTEEYDRYEYDQTYNFYSINIDLNTNKIINNQELLELYNVDSATMFEKIIKDISNNVTVDEFLLSTDGNIAAEKESVKNFRNKAKTYAKYIDNRYDIVTLYIKDNNLYAAYEQNDILKILGMGTHMGMGLEIAPQSIKIK